MSEELKEKINETTPEEVTETKEEIVSEEVQEEVKEEPLKEETAEEVKEESVPEEPKEEPVQEPVKEEPQKEEIAPAQEAEKDSPKEDAPMDDKPKDDVWDKLEENKKKSKKQEKPKEKEKAPVDNNKNKRKHRLSRSARTRRLVILITTLYLDAVLLVFCYKYIGEFVNGLLKLIGGDLNGSIGNRKFATSLLLLVVFIIINLISISLYRDARKIKDKAPDDLMAMLGDTESIDGHRVVESEYTVDEEEGKQVVYRNAKTIESIKITKVQQDFIDACRNNGLDVDKSTARLVLSSIVASRLVIVKEPNEELRKKFFKTVSSFFGNDLYLTTVSDDATKLYDVIWKLTSEGNVQTDFSRGLNASRNYPDRVNIVSLDNVKAEGMRAMYKEILDYIKNPSIPCALRIGNRNVDNGYRQLPKNVWFLFGMDKESIIPSEVAKYSITLELNLKACDVPAEKATIKPIDYPQVLDFLNDSYEDHFIQEDVWKKLDEFFEVFSNRGEYFIDNRIVREMERFAAVYLALDGDQADLIDTLLEKKLLLVALPNEYKKVEVDEEGLVGQAEKILGADFVTNSQQILKKIKID